MGHETPRPVEDLRRRPARIAAEGLFRIEHKVPRSNHGLSSVNGVIDNLNDGEVVPMPYIVFGKSGFVTAGYSISF